MIVVGLTGGIASGKSTVTDILRKRFSYIVLDADEMARQAVVKNSTGLRRIVDAFGSEVLFENGDLNRYRLGKIIAEDEKAREKLNQIIHPEIIKIYKTKLAYYKKSGISLVFFDCPLLFEIGFEKYVDETMVVIANRGIRIRRIMMRDKVSQEFAEQKIDMQMSDVNKIKKSDIIIENNGSLDDLLITLNTYFSNRKNWTKKINL
jgi:dephospho-CoA kinase